MNPLRKPSKLGWTPSYLYVFSKSITLEIQITNMKLPPKNLILKLDMTKSIKSKSIKSIYQIYQI